jgi:hypothetical protein
LLKKLTDNHATIDKHADECNGKRQIKSREESNNNNNLLKKNFIKKKKSTEEFTKTEAICGHQSFIDKDNPNRSDNIEHPCGCINCSLLISLARRSHYHVFPYN